MRSSVSDSHLVPAIPSLLPFIGNPPPKFSYAYVTQRPDGDMLLTIARNQHKYVYDSHPPAPPKRTRREKATLSRK